jgi:predicted transcriptional regulator
MLPPGDFSLADNRLTRYELELMDILWNIGQGTVQDVCDKLSRELAYTTVMTTLNLLASRKQVLSRTKEGRAFVYRPLVSREEVSRSILGELKAVLFGNHPSSLVLNLMADHETNEKDAAILREAVRKLEENQ